MKTGGVNSCTVIGINQSSKRLWIGNRQSLLQVKRAASAISDLGGVAAGEAHSQEAMDRDCGIAIYEDSMTQVTCRTGPITSPHGKEWHVRAGEIDKTLFWEA